jgi:CDP-diacylglycerol--glycerol-3-phosphate 3-phosphatidyltransferase
MLKRIWTFSNLLSLSRMLLLVPLAYFLFGEVPNGRFWATIVILVGGATDYFDGYFARRLHEITDLGKILDPLADKVAAAGTTIMLLLIGAIPLWYVLVVIIRDVIILFGALYIRSRKNIITQSNWPGKIAVSLIALVVLLSMIGEPSLEWLRDWAIWLSVAMMALSLALYAQRLFMGISVARRSES